jgi:hypothetical protein
MKKEKGVACMKWIRGQLVEIGRRMDLPSPGPVGLSLESGA